MERFPRTSAEADQLIQMGKLLNEAIQTVTEEWKNEKFSKTQTNGTNGVNGARGDGTANTADILPSWPLYQAQRTILSLTGALTELVAEPSHRLTELMAEYWESRALFIATERRIPDLLHEAGDEGMEITEIAKKTGIEHLKLSRIMRCLASIHVFRLTAPERFANNRISAQLVHNKHLSAYITMFSGDIYTSAERLPKHLLGPQGASYSVTETAWHEALGTSKSRWEWLAEKIDPNEIQNDGVGYPGVPDPSLFAPYTPDADGKIPRPELELFGLGMVGGGRSQSASQPYDFPWRDLPHGATVVDVGGGVGGFSMQLLRVYPHLNCVVEDRAEVVRQGEQEVWPQQAPDLLQSGKVKFLAHDFFKPNPIEGADVYFLRGVLHDWSDEYCVQILIGICNAMSDKSRLLLCEQVMNSPYGCDELAPAPYPLPANYGYFSRFQAARDLSLMACINGIERTPAQFKDLIEKAGLKLVKIHELRSIYCMIEITK